METTTGKDYFVINDANGKSVAIKWVDLIEVITDNLIFGLSPKAIFALRKEYFLRGGKSNPTPEDIRETFSRKL